MINGLMVFIGGGLGSVLRYAVKVFIDKNIGINYPWATFTVNIIGCLFLGFMFAFLLNKTTFLSTPAKLFLTVGIAGGFTTFSTYSLEIIELIKEGHWILSIIYASTSVLLGVLAIVAGIALAKAVS